MLETRTKTYAETAKEKHELVRAAYPPIDLAGREHGDAVSIKRRRLDQMGIAFADSAVHTSCMALESRMRELFNPELHNGIHPEPDTAAKDYQHAAIDAIAAGNFLDAMAYSALAGYYHATK